MNLWPRNRNFYLKNPKLNRFLDRESLMYQQANNGLGGIRKLAPPTQPTFDWKRKA